MKWITTPSWIRRNQEGLSSRKILINYSTIAKHGQQLRTDIDVSGYYLE